MLFFDTENLFESVRPVAAEVRYGSEVGLLSRQQVVRLFLGWLTQGRSITETEESIALLLPDEEERFSSLLATLPSQDSLPAGLFRDGGMRFWVFVLLSRFLKSSVESLFGQVDDLYEFFAYDTSIAPFVRQPYDPEPVELSLARIVEHVRSEQVYYASR